MRGNAATYDESERRKFVAATETASLTWSTDRVEQLLKGGGWRDRLVGSWMVGVWRYEAAVPLIGSLLMQSTTSYAGHGYCFALLAIRSQASVEYLCSYLDLFLPRLRDEFDQPWAMGALLILDSIEGTVRGKHYEQLWNRWAKFDYGGQLPSRDAKPTIAQLKGLLDIAETVETGR